MFFLKKISLFSFLFIYILQWTFAKDAFNSKLQEADRARLNRGEVIMINTGNVSKICLDDSSFYAKKIISMIKNFRPNYLAEVIAIRPYKGNEDLPKKINQIICDVPSYKGIPYWSVRHERYYDLYSEAQILSQKTTGSVTSIKARLYMQPVGNIENSFTTQTETNFFYYESVNDNDLFIQNIKCVKANCMKSAIVVFKNDDKWILYGAGGLNAMRLPLLTSRIEVSFLNRIKSFCNFVFEKM